MEFEAVLIFRFGAQVEPPRHALQIQTGMLFLGKAKVYNIPVFD